MAQCVDLDQMAADIGQADADRVMCDLGGQTFYIPARDNVARSSLRSRVPAPALEWLAEQYGSCLVAFTSPCGRTAREKAAALLADVVEAGLDPPSRSATDIAAAHGVTTRKGPAAASADQKMTGTADTSTPAPCAIRDLLRAFRADLMDTLDRVDVAIAELEAHSELGGSGTPIGCDGKSHDNCDHRQLHRPGQPRRIDADPELRQFVVERIDRMTVAEMELAIATHFPVERRVRKSAIHRWWQLQRRQRGERHTE